MSEPPAAPRQLSSLVALITALGGLVAAWQGYEGGQDTQKLAYEALRLRSELQGRQLEELARQQAETNEWVSELTQKLDERTRTTERVLRKVARPKSAVPLPPEPPPSVPPPPQPLEVKQPAPLPPFEALGR